MQGFVNLIKLCVGADTVEDLAAWQDDRMARSPGHVPCHVTRMWPRRADELLNGGSLYWVFRGAVLARQRIVALEERRGKDGILRCGLIFDPEIIRTEALPRRAFQGWRYLKPEEAPADLGSDEGAAALSPELRLELAELGLL